MGRRFGAGSFVGPSRGGRGLLGDLARLDGLLNVIGEG
jgi:hypothetical protein